LSAYCLHHSSVFKISLKALRLVFLLFWAAQASAECVSYIEGPVVFDVSGCKRVDPSADLDWQDEAYRDIKALPPNLRNRFVSKYQGFLLTGKVVQSNAVQKGLGTKGVLEGQTIKVFVPAQNFQCAMLDAARMKAALKEECCDGSAEVPCMLKTSYFFQQLNLIGKAGSSDGNTARKAAENDPQFREAVKAFKEKNYKESVKKLNSIKQAGKLDLRGHFLLATAYHRQEQCGLAIAPLEVISEKARAKEAWADDEKIVREAEFLLARCYARQFDNGKAIIILNSYLISPQKYRREIQQSLKAPEFGSIHSTKEYEIYRRQAEKIVNRN
jgi:hypothetical protein